MENTNRARQLAQRKMRYMRVWPLFALFGASVGFTALGRLLSPKNLTSTTD